MIEATGRVVVTACLLALAAGPAAAQDAAAVAWDAAEVTKIAQQAADAIDQVYQSVTRTRTGASVGSGQAANYARLKDRVRVARNESRHLVTALKKGEGLVETRPVHERLMSLVRDAREIGRSMFLEQDTLTKADEAVKQLEALAPYYETSEG